MDWTRFSNPLRGEGARKRRLLDEIMGYAKTADGIEGYDPEVYDNLFEPLSDWTAKLYAKGTLVKMSELKSLRDAYLDAFGAVGIDPVTGESV